MAYVFGSPVVSSAAVQQLASATTNGGGQLNLLQQQHQQQQQQQQQHSNNKQQNSLGNNSSVASAAEQISRLQEQNGTLQRKLHTKSTEGARLQAKLERAEDEILLFRQTLDRIHRQLNAGEAPPGKGKGGHHGSTGNGTGEPSCQCCFVAEKPFLCEWDNCGKRFRQRQHLEAHRNIHTGLRYTCEWPKCGKSFCRKYNLVEHAKMHTTGNPNLCTYPQCGKSFASKYGLQRHQNAQHLLPL
ncbi:positive regulation of osteoclast differentiation [Tyrophagus putrescentiae]|nr:positive regulation of osteoclast differentiation [Tyrophagus putrescentiae]